MKKYYLIFLLLSFSCNGQKPNRLKSFTPDVSISKIYLLDTLNIKSFLGQNVMSNLQGGVMKSASFSNQPQNETLEVILHPGSNLNEFSKFRVFKSIVNGNKPKVDTQNFITESGVSLNMSVKNLLKIKGKPTSEKTMDNLTVYEYVINDYKTSHFLKKYNLPLYKAKYYFKDLILVRFEFGFDYP